MSSPVSSPTKKFKSGITKINEINGTQGLVSIRGRIINIRPPITFTSGNGGQVSSALVMDNTGTVEVTFFNDFCNKYTKSLKTENIYTFQKLKPKVIENNKWKKGTIDFSLTVGYDTNIEIAEDSSIPVKTLKLEKFSSLGKKVNEIVNISGIVLASSDVQNVQTYQKREVKLGDGNCALTLTLWNEVASETNLNNGDIITVENTAVRVYKQNITCSGGSITNYVDEDISGQLKLWWEDNEDKDLPLIAKIESWGNYMTFKEAQKETKLHFEFYVVAVVTQLCTDDPTYKACTKMFEGRKCNKKIWERCNRCSGEVEFEYQMMSKAQLCDYTDVPTIVTLFNDNMEKVLNIGREEINKENNEDDTMFELRKDVAIEEAMKQALYQQMGFWISAKKNLENLEIEYTVVNVEKINYECYTNHLKSSARKNGLVILS